MISIFDVIDNNQLLSLAVSLIPLVPQEVSFRYTVVVCNLKRRVGKTNKEQLTIKAIHPCGCQDDTVGKGLQQATTMHVYNRKDWH